MMTPREIVLRTLDFTGPERTAMALPDPYPHDFVYGGPENDPEEPGNTWREVGGGRWEYTDEWGNLWARLDATSKGEVVRGALEDWDQLDRLVLPKLSQPARYARAKEVFSQDHQKYRIGCLPGFPFSIARKIRKLENYLADLVIERECVDALNARVEAVLAEVIDRLAEYGADGIMFAEDWGSQDRLLISPPMWREIFKPGFQRLCARAHDHGMFMLMHSCGYIWDIIDDLIEVGINALQLDQPELFGIEQLDEAFGGRVTFFCPVDIQRTLQSQDRVRIEDSARRMVLKLGGHQGGFIAGYYGDFRSIGLTQEIQDWACQAFVKYGSGEVSRLASTTSR